MAVLGHNGSMTMKYVTTRNSIVKIYSIRLKNYTHILWCVVLRRVLVIVDVTYVIQDYLHGIQFILKSVQFKRTLLPYSST